MMENPRADDVIVGFGGGIEGVQVAVFEIDGMRACETRNSFCFYQGSIAKIDRRDLGVWVCPRDQSALHRSATSYKNSTCLRLRQSPELA